MFIFGTFCLITKSSNILGREISKLVRCLNWKLWISLLNIFVTNPGLSLASLSGLHKLIYIPIYIYIYIIYRHVFRCSTAHQCSLVQSGYGMATIYTQAIVSDNRLYIYNIYFNTQNFFSFTLHKLSFLITNCKYQLTLI